MSWLIRKIRQLRKGGVQIEDDIHFGQELPIGRGADQAVLVTDMKVALHHARLLMADGGKYRIESLTASGVRVNGRLEQTAVLEIGAKIEIGDICITLIKPPTDLDMPVAAAVEVSPLAPDPQRGKVQYQALSLSQSGLSKRRAAWLGFSLVLVFGLLLPMGMHFIPGLGSALAVVPVPTRASWEAGELASPHHYFGQDCKACHAQPFVPTRNEECLSCHQKTEIHADPVKFSIPELASETCSQCHRDHNGEDGLILTQQGLCSDCHADLPARSQGASASLSVSDFGIDHPEFQVTLARWTDDGEYAPIREVLRGDLKEGSGLIFPHDVHMDPEGVRAPSGRRVLECDSCHVEEPGGAKMMPVEFEPMCQECHLLDFDPQAPGRQVPHGKVPEILFMLDEYYSRVALEGGYEDARAPQTVRIRRRPGQQAALSANERQEALTWARDKARQVGQSLFEGRACVTCHVVTPRGEGEERGWHIAPVRVQGIWFPASVFTHAKHDTMQCEDCHAARQSPSSDDILMMPMEGCQTCHGGEHAEGLLKSTCISCHVYHDPKQPSYTSLHSAGLSPVH